MSKTIIGVPLRQADFLFVLHEYPVAEYLVSVRDGAFVIERRQYSALFI